MPRAFHIQVHVVSYIFYDFRRVGILGSVVYMPRLNVLEYEASDVSQSYHDDDSDRTVGGKGERTTVIGPKK